MKKHIIIIVLVIFWGGFVIKVQEENKTDSLNNDVIQSIYTVCFLLIFTCTAIFVSDVALPKSGY